jgi:hypothetical protein
MKRSLFTKSLLCGTVGLFGCDSKHGIRNAGPKPTRGELKFYGLPHGGELLTSILPRKVFQVLGKPEPTVHLERFSAAPDEGSRERNARFNAERLEYARRFRDAENYFHSWNLASEHFYSLERLSQLLHQQEREDLIIAYEMSGRPGRIVSLDLTGSRLNLSQSSFTDPDDPFCVGPTPLVSSECFDELLKIKSIRRIFLNYTDCPFPKFLELVSCYEEFEALGLPNGLRPDQLQEVITGRKIDVLDLSGYEARDIRDQLVDVAIRHNVRWLMFSGADFDSAWMKVDWTVASDLFRGVIKLRSIGIFDHEKSKK